jgi:hypothetical protein
LDLTKNQAPSTYDSATSEAQKASEIDVTNAESQNDERSTRQVKQRRGVRV